MSNKRKYKAGTVVFLCCATHDAQSREHEAYTLTEDMSHDELEEVAKEFFYNTKEPEWWFQEENPDEE
jgi:hypothetical protein